MTLNANCKQFNRKFMSSCIDAVGRKDFSLRSHELEIVKREVSDDREANYFNPRNNT